MQVQAWGGGNVSVNIINNSGAQVGTRSAKNGNGTELTVMIDEIVASQLTTRGSKTNAAINSLNSRSLVRR